MSIGKTEYLELRLCNQTNDTMNATITNDRYQPILDDNLDYTVELVRFDIDNRGVPIFVPYIQPPSLDIFPVDSSTGTGFGETNGTTTTTGGGIHIITQNEYDYSGSIGPWTQQAENGNFNTNLQIMFECFDNNGNVTQYCSYVEWIPEHLGEIKPIVCDRGTTISNRYFHTYNIQHFFKLLESTINNIVPPIIKTALDAINCQFEMDILVDNKVSLLVPTKAFETTETNWRLVINRELRMCLGLHCINHDTIPGAYVIVMNRSTSQLLPLSTFGLQTCPYLQFTENFRPTSMFPFKTILVTSNDISANPLKRYNNCINYTNAEVSVLTDYLLTVDNVQSFYDCISYQPPMSDRKIAITSTNIRKITVNFILETPDYYQCPLLLLPMETCGILLKFTGV